MRCFSSREKRAGGGPPWRCGVGFNSELFMWKRRKTPKEIGNLASPWRRRRGRGRGEGMAAGMLAAVVGVLALAGGAHAGEGGEIHGSGTTNPSKLVWEAMGLLEARANPAIHASYRAVGSGTGQFEFMGEANPAGAFTPYTHFGAGDIPFNKEDFSAMRAAGRDFVHIPFVLGAISMFHSVPEANVPGGLNMTGCVLAKIFARKITTWDDPEVRAINPRMNVPSGQAVTVLHRVHGSSSTASVTEYMNTACALEWPAGKVGKSIEWHPDTVEAEGSDGMANALQSTPYSIGYVDAGHGHKLGLSEIELRNRAGYYVKSTEAEISAAAAEALKEGLLPSTFDESFENVKLLNLDGEQTWPIVAMSYLYLDKNLSSLGDQGGLVKALATFLLSDEVQGSMLGKFGFVRIPPAVMALNQKALDSMTLAPGAEWSFETAEKTQKGGGAEEKVFSGKRRTYAEYQRSHIQDDVDSLAASDSPATNSRTAAPAVGMAGLQQDVTDLKDKENLTSAALAMAAISLALNVVLAALVATLFRKIAKSNYNSMEAEVKTVF